MMGKRAKESEGRYARQLITEEWKQENLKASKVLIAGVGALGSVVSTNLVSLGIGEVILVDFDTVELSNLNRQLIFREKDIGRRKVAAASDYLRELNPDVAIKTYDVDVHTVPKEVFSACNVIVDCLDTFEVRRWVNSVCVGLKKPLVHGGIYGWLGNVQVVLPFITPCLECQPLIPAERLQKACTPPGERRKAEEEEEKRKEKEEKIKVPSISTVSTLIGAIQAQETLKLIMKGEGTKILDNYLFYDGKTEAFTQVQLEKNPNCIVCGEKFTLKTIEYAIDKEEDIRSLKDRLIASWGLEEPIRVISKGVILEDNVKIGELDAGANDTLYVYDHSLFKPMRLMLKT
jgi:molybdopterin/thiamine biosynthesis adenylyltransferase